jgi:hypothetical protein
VARERHDRQDHADREHGHTDGEGRPEHGFTPVPGPLRLPSLWGLPLWDAEAQAPDEPHRHARDTQPDAMDPVGLAGVRRTRPDLVADPLQAVRTRLYLIRGSVEFAAQEVGEVPLPAVEAAAGSHHDSRSSSARSAAMPRAV